jgi:hypothetical protein
MKRTEIYRFRLSPEEKARLLTEAEAKGLTKADRIREGLGWDRRLAPSLPPGPVVESLVSGVDSEDVDAAEKPGLASIAEIGERLRTKGQAHLNPAA